MLEIKTYTNNPNFIPEDIFLAGSDAEQAEDGRPGMVQMLDGRPIACVDVLMVDRDSREILLPTRRSRPAEGLWFIGGGIKRSQGLDQAAAKAMARETGFDVDASRFEMLAISRFVWDYRDEQPQGNGRVDINFCYVFEPSADELDSITLNDQEYDASKGLVRYDRAGLGKAIAAEGNPAKQVLLDYYDKVFPS